MGFFKSLRQFVVQPTSVIQIAHDEVEEIEVSMAQGNPPVAPVQYVRNPDGSYTEVGAPVVTGVPDPQPVDTLEMRLAAADAAARGVTVDTASVINQPPYTGTERRVGAYDRRVGNPEVAITVTPDRRVSLVYDRRVTAPETHPVTTTPTERRVGAYGRRLANGATPVTVVPAERRSGGYDRRVTNPLVGIDEINLTQ